MEVLENNFKPKTWEIVCTNPECNSKLRYNKNDVVSKETRFFYLHTIKCPICGKTIDVKHW